MKHGQDQVRKEPINTDLTHAFVMAAHRDFDEVKALYEKEPDLLHAVVNWGGSDWEGALGAAAHTGRRDIAEFLLSKGARMDIFTAAMLGDLPLVIEMLRVHPEAVNAAGPHGIPLIHHAKVGGEQAKKVHEYLLNLKQSEVAHI